MKHDILDLMPAGRMGAPAWPRLTRQEAQARSALAQRGHASAVNLGGCEWHVRLLPVNDTGQVADPDEWQLQLQWGGAPFEFYVPAGTARAWVEATCPGLDVPALPDAFVAPLLEAAGAQVVGSLAALRKGRVSIDSVARCAGPARVAGHVFRFEASHGDCVINGRMATSSLGLMLAAGLVAGIPPVDNRLAIDDLPVPLRARIGRTRLPASELARLEPGDAVLVDQVDLTPGGELWLGNALGGLRVQCEDTRLTVVEAFMEGGVAMLEDSEPAETGAVLVGLGQLPMEVAFDLGCRTLTLAEVRTLQPGQVIALERPLDSAINIRVNGALVGTGELVEIDGRLGVVVGSLCEPPPQPLPPEDVQAEETAE